MSKTRMKAEKETFNVYDSNLPVMLFVQNQVDKSPSGSKYEHDIGYVLKNELCNSGRMRL